MKDNKKNQKTALKKKNRNLVLGIVAVVVIGLAILSGMKSNRNNKVQLKINLRTKFQKNKKPSQMMD